jgi:hypothetical protein
MPTRSTFPTPPKQSADGAEMIIGIRDARTDRVSPYTRKTRGSSQTTGNHQEIDLSTISLSCAPDQGTLFRGLPRLTRKRRTMKYTGIFQMFSILTESRP